MTATKTNRWLGLALAGLALAAAGCDPYEEVGGGAPAVVRVGLIDQSFSYGTPIYVEAPDTDGVWRIPTLIDPATNALLIVTTNKLLSGASISLAPGSCDPAAGWNFAGAPLADVTYQWWSCYYPSSASENWGASILLYQSDTDNDPYTAVLDYGTTYTIVGSVEDVGGTALSFEVEFTTIP
jgi:hypothetical protein